MRAVAVALLALAIMVGVAWQHRLSAPRPLKSSAAVRAERRAYEGAPPVVPHVPFGMACVACHADQAIQVPDVGLSPPMPHADTPGMSRDSNCRQCHVFRRTEELFVSSGFQGLAAVGAGDRMFPGAPPRLPHRIFMREACAACHAGPAVREGIRCTHPDRARCLQCHVPVSAAGEFAR